MKYNQCNTLKKFVYIVIIIHTILWGFIAIITLVDVSFVVKSGTKLEQIISGLFFLLLSIIGLISYIIMKINKKLKCTIELTADKIIYQEKNRTVEMKWEDVKEVFMFPDSLWLSSNRIVIFVATGGKLFGKKNKITSERIWSEYNDEMIKEIKEYWHGLIINEDKYLRYKKRRDRKLKK